MIVRVCESLSVSVLGCVSVKSRGVLHFIYNDTQRGHNPDPEEDRHTHPHGGRSLTHSFGIARNGKFHSIPASLSERSPSIREEPVY